MKLKSKKKIIHLGFKHSNNDGRIFLKECTSLAKDPDYQVIYITSNINSNADSDTKNNVERRIISADSRRIIRVFLFHREIKKLLLADNQIDLVHLHEAPMLLIALWIKRRGIKVIYDSHEDYYKQLKSGRGRLIATIYKAIEKYVCKRIDGVIFPCHMTKKEVFDYPVRRIEYIDNYPIVDVDHIKYEPQKEFCACYAGAISESRGVYHAVKAWGKAGIKGILAGEFSNNVEREAIASLEEFKNVTYYGKIPPEKMPDFYKQASVGMANLLNRGQYHESCNLPTKVGEYMMHGIPSIIYRTPYVEKLMQKYEFGIMVDPENVDEISNALILLKNNPELTARLAENAIKAIKEQFNWATQEEKLLSFYKHVFDES